MAVALDCVLPRPDIAELHEQLNTEFSARLLGGGPVLPNSVEDVLGFVMGGAINLFYGVVAQSMRENDPAEMCCDNLVVYGATHGINMRAATRAKGYVELTGTPGAPIPATFRLVGPSAREYKLDLSVRANPLELDSAGRATIRVVAALPGASFNLPPDQTLTVSTTTPGIAMTATILGNGLTGGGDDEDCDTYRARILQSERADVIVANEAWYLRESMTYPGVTRVCTEDCTGYCEQGFIALYPFFEGVYPPFGVPPQGVLDEMTEWMFGGQPGRGQGLAPLAVRGEYLAAVPATVNVTARCFQGCDIGVEERIRTALTDFIRANYCVGSTICFDQLRAAIYRALGSVPCLAEVQFAFEAGSLRFQDLANAYLQCGRFAVVGDITVSTGP